MNYKLICKASPKGITFYRDGEEKFHSKFERPVNQCYDEKSDENFIDLCLHGTKCLSLQEFRRMPATRIKNIITLHREAIALIVSMKKEIANSWISKALGNSIKKLPDDEIGEDYLNIVIPRPLLIEKLLTLKRKL